MLFSQGHPQVLTHGDLSRTNILVDKDTYEITGIVDWSFAAALPHGAGLPSLGDGYRGLSGWHDYACRSQLHMHFER
jgi:aminoglycoside phosphotransferase